MLTLSASAASAQTASPKASHAAATTAVSEITLIKASDGVAVIRARDGALDKIKVGVLVGTTKAVVKEISAARLVLDETFTDKDGKSNRALIVMKEGERGGTRYLQHNDEPGFMGTRPRPVAPEPPEAKPKPAPKKPPRM